MSANSNEQTDAMNNFLLLIKTSKSEVQSLSRRQPGGQVIELRNFIESRMSEGRLMIAYPLEMAGVIVSGSKGNFTEIRIDSEAELISAFYLVGAESLDAAVSFAKSDPRFDHSRSSRLDNPALSAASFPTVAHG